LQHCIAKVTECLAGSADDSSDERCVSSLGELLHDATDSWNADVLAIATESGNKPLSTLGMELFKSSGVVECLHLDREKLNRFLIEVEQGYSEDVPYHNRAHAASVFHFMYALLTRGGVVEACENFRNKPLIILSSLTAAAIHDYEHKGLSNDFLSRSCDERAQRYEGSVNEKHHAAAGLALLEHPHMNFIDALSSSDAELFRRIVTELVLSTDAAQGKQFMTRFNERHPPGGEAKLIPECEEDVILALQMALKCADLGHLALDWDAHLDWVLRLESEFFAQGDREKDLGFQDISFLMDREKPGVSQTQTGFIDFVVLPQFTSLVGAFPEASPMLTKIQQNADIWRERERQHDKLRRRCTM
jgi:cAMP-specific phosphodiesterase 4/calcium/calmodulin-dependent 3',5'-cyclic nucleotide phosphodiesterase